MTEWFWKPAKEGPLCSEEVLTWLRKEMLPGESTRWWQSLALPRWAPWGRPGAFAENVGYRYIIVFWSKCCGTRRRKMHQERQNEALWGINYPFWMIVWPYIQIACSVLFLMPSLELPFLQSTYIRSGINWHLWKCLVALRRLELVVMACFYIWQRIQISHWHNTICTQTSWNSVTK